MTGLLHNMSVRPRTDVRCIVPAIAEEVALFSLPADAPVPATADLDDAWTAYGLQGAALVLDARCTRAYRRTVEAGDRVLAANVLARTRGHVLTAGAPLTLDPVNLRRRLASDDPRLVALAAGRTGEAGR